MAKQKKTSEMGKTSLYLTTDKIQALKFMAFMSKKKQTDIIDEAVADYIRKWEKKHGSIPKI